MGAGMIFILVLVVFAAVVAGVMFFGLGAGLWAKRTEPGGDGSSGPDLVDEEMTSTAGPQERPASGPPAQDRTHG